jgi:hypothetical protein
MNLEQNIEVILVKLSVVEEILQDLRSPQKPPEPPDRCGIKTAKTILGTEEHPVSDAWIYKNTHNKTLPHGKLNGRLVFSRRQLIIWREEHTVLPSSPENEMNNKLAAAARKHLRNEK